uniref:Small ribosomal subunit protein mS38 n=1 Tax=Tetradesmus obliquus TaxID=3088 RepID=A0A383V7K2_TETOB|eukprot:jgi/Sobl393_1/8695/SZX60910.1
MFSKRAAGRLLRVFQGLGSHSSSGCQAQASAYSASLSGSTLTEVSWAGSRWQAASTARCYSSASFWDVPHPSPRHELFLELDTARGMLPNRANFKTHFSPHGVQLMPHRIAHMAPFDPLAAYEAAEGAAEDYEHLDVPIMADSVKRKRRMKIKKHKFKKRMKKMRHQLR